MYKGLKFVKSFGKGWHYVNMVTQCKKELKKRSIVGRVFSTGLVPLYYGRFSVCSVPQLVLANGIWVWQLLPTGVSTHGAAGPLGAKLNHTTLDCV